MGWTHRLRFSALVLIGYGLTAIPATAAEIDTLVVHDAASGRWTATSAVPFYYGEPGDAPLLCDWNRDGSDTVGLYRNDGFLYLRNSNTQGFADVKIFYGLAGDLPVCGDWNGDRTDTIGIFRPSNQTFYLRNSNTQGFGEIIIKLGSAGDLPFAGDWDGDGLDTVGLRNPASGAFVLADGNGVAASRGFFGTSSDRLVVGDFDGNGRDSLAVQRNVSLLVANDLGSTVATTAFAIPTSGQALAGRWQGASAPAPIPLPPPPTTSPPPPPVTSTTRPPTTSPSPTTTIPPPTTTTPPPPPGTTPPGADTQAPLGAIVLSPGTNIQAQVTANPEGATFFLTSGTYPRQSFRPKHRQIFIGQRGASGERLAILDGEGATAEAIVADAAVGVTVRGLVVKNYSGRTEEQAAINVRIPRAGRDWTIESNEVAYNGSGIFPATGNRVIGNNVHHNQRYGIAGEGPGILIDGNEIAYNRTDASLSIGNSSATKFVRTIDLVIRNNWVHHNQGHGLWTDIDNLNTLFEGNTIEYNWWAGIHQEISYRAVIRNNRIIRNGWGGTADPFYATGITVANSPDVEIYGNLLDSNAGGIVGRQWAHPGDANPSSWPYGERVLKNLNVHDNDIILINGWTPNWAGWHGIENANRAEVFSQWNNHYWGNRYTVDAGYRSFWWNRDFMDLTTWLARGHG